MLGVTSINRCEACEAFHGRWAAGVGLQRHALSADEAAAYEFGQHVAVAGPDDARPPADRAGDTGASSSRRRSSSSSPTSRATGSWRQPGHARPPGR